MADEDYKVLLEQQTKLLAAMQTQMQVMQQQMSNMMAGSTIDAIKSHVSVPWPQPLDVESGDLFENFEFFRNGWENYCTATGMSKWGPEKSEVKASILLSAVGTAAVKKFMEFGLTEKEKKSEKEIF
jgi:hypothetical protein